MICLLLSWKGSSSFRAASADIPDPLSPPLPIIHRFWQVFRLHPVSSQSYCMYVRPGRPAFAWPYAGVQRSTSLMSSSLLLRQYPSCLARLTCIVFVMGGKWPYNWCLVGCCRQDLFKELYHKSQVILIRKEFTKNYVLCSCKSRLSNKLGYFEEEFTKTIVFVQRKLDPSRLPVIIQSTLLSKFRIWNLSFPKQFTRQRVDIS